MVDEFEGMTQQGILHAAMTELGMSRPEFAERIKCPLRTLDKWLLHDDSTDHRGLNPFGWNAIKEVLAHERLKKKHQQLSEKYKKLREQNKL